MAQSIANSSAATPRESLAGLCPSPAKAELHPQEGASRLRELAGEALKRVTSQKAAATDIGIHEGRLSHKLKDGSLTLAQLESLENGPKFYAELGKLLVEEFGALEDPKARLRKRLRLAIEVMQEMDQFLEWSA